MNVYYSALLGLLQGFSEFLPISSSGHLVLVQSLFPNFDQPGVLFDVVLHAGTLFAIVFYFRKKLFSVSLRYILLLIVGTVPAVVSGLLFREEIEILFESRKVVGYALLVTASINFFTDRIKTIKSNLNIKKSFVVGIAQAVAIIPGISRSGSTIFAGVLQGVNKKEAAEFSFLLSIPAVAGANILELMNHGIQDSFNVKLYLMGFLAAFAAGLIAIPLVMNFLSKKHFKYFALYCLIIGLIAILI